MKIVKAEFMTSVADNKHFLATDRPIIAVAGKSNVGKSTFINMLANQKKLAKTSNTPGRTRLINYFDFGEFILADLPGYGFAEVSKAEKLKWANLMQDFFERTEIKHTFSLMDLRHNPTKDDIQMVRFLYESRLPFTVIATKEDKLPKTRIKPACQNLATCLAIGISDVISVSSTTGSGKDRVLSKLDNILNIPI